MATWKETSVLGEQCDSVGCSGYGGGSGFFGAGGAEAGAEGSREVHSMPPRGGQDIVGLAAATPAPLELGLNVRWMRGWGLLEQSGLLSHNEQSIRITQSSKTSETHQ